MKTRLARLSGLPFRMATANGRVLPEFLIVGAQKCGTTSLYRYLEQHLQIVPAARKEVHYFDWYYQKGLRWYRAHFPTRRDVRLREQKIGKRVLTGEASPYYLFYRYAPERIRDLLPGVPMIVLLRNPVDRAWSHYHHVRKRQLETLGFEEALEREEARLAPETARIEKDPSYHSDIHVRYSYKARGIYADQLTRWFDIFGQDRLLIRRAEDFYADPGSIFNDVQEFLGLERVDLPHYRRFLEGDYGDGMRSETRAYLEDYFRPHNRRLEELLGRSLGWD